MNPGGHGIFDFIALDREDDAAVSVMRRGSKRSGRDPLAIGRWRNPQSARRKQC